MIPLSEDPHLDALRRDRDEARAALDRVQALCDEWEAIDAGKPYAMDHLASCADDLRAALDGDQ